MTVNNRNKAVSYLNVKNIGGYLICSYDLQNSQSNIKIKKN